MSIADEMKKLHRSHIKYFIYCTP